MANAALDAKAEDVVILDLRKLSYSFEFFVLCSATSDRHLQTVAEDIEDLLSGNGNKYHKEGRPDGGWMLLDDGQVIAHVFLPDTREFYRLERLWADAPHVPIPKKKRSK
jgi:ribosome-associated protein